jgi:F-type H+-transporting ATPase subunit b
MLALLLAGADFLSFNAGFAFYVAVTLAIFMFIMYKFALPVMASAIQEREATITNSLEAAEKALARAEEVGNENKKALREAESKAQAIRDEAVKEAEVIRSQRLEAAKDEATQMVEQARLSIEQEKKAAIEALRKEVSDLAIQAASKILDAELDADKNKSLVDNFIQGVTKN